MQVEPDLSNAAPFLAAALVTGGRVTVPGWPQHTTQAGDAIRDILDAMGADVSLSREGLTVSRHAARSTASTSTCTTPASSPLWWPPWPPSPTPPA